MKRFLLSCAALLSTAAGHLIAADIKVGVIGLDTSHSIAFTKIINDKTWPGAAEEDPNLPTLRVTVTYPQGSKDIPESVKRVPEYTEQMKALGVTVVDSIETLVAQVDAVLLESNDGKVHWEQIQPILKAKKPVFVDKPVAASLVDVLRIYRAAEATQTPIFSSSALRFGKATLKARAGEFGKLQRVTAWSPAHLEPSHADLFWYGIHGVEPIFTALGTGITQVTREQTEDGLIQVTGTWSDGRVGVFQEANSTTRKGYGGIAVSDTGEHALSDFEGYEPLVAAIVTFFRTGKSPVSAQETLEIYAFMEAADESKRQGGKPVLIRDVLTKAEAALKP